MTPYEKQQVVIEEYQRVFSWMQRQEWYNQKAVTKFMESIIEIP